MILNRAAGTAAREELSDAEILRLFQQAGISARIEHPDEARDLAAVARAAVESDEEVIVAAGGDGTISAVAEALVGSKKILGVLPVGTLNHFAKDLGLPLELPVAIETLAQGHVAEVDVGEVNGHIFINNSSLGLYPHIVARREAQQERLARSKLAAFVWATLGAFRRFPFLDLRIIVDGKQLVRRTAFVFIGNNEYRITGFDLGGRACLDAGRLGLYLTHRTGRLGLFRLGLRALLGRIEEAADFDAFCVTEATIDARHARLLVAMDGEVSELATPLHYRIRPRALRVLVPAEKT